MDDPTALRSLLTAFEERGSKHAFSLHSGAAFLGWVVEVGYESVDVIEAADPTTYPAPGDDEKPIRIAFTDIDRETLAYWDDAEARWVAFRG